MWPLAEARLARDSKYYERRSVRMDRVEGTTRLDCALVVLCDILVDVVVGANGLTEFVAHDHARALRARTATKEHDPRASVRIGAL